jgi:DNA polymerase III subunit gamma/tau
MVYPHSQGDLYHKYRPQRFEEIVGHKGVVNSIREAVNSPEPPHAFLLSGGSGTGKTTTARIIALTLNCEKKENGEPCLSCSSCQLIVNKRAIEISEQNAADVRGIDDMRAISASMSSMPMNLDRKVFILDECHQLSKDAQSLLLKVLEDAPPHVFIILCTTEPEKLLPTVRNRCQHFIFGALGRVELSELVKSVATYEGISEELLLPIIPDLISASAGSPRNILVVLQQAIQTGLENKEDIKKMFSGEDLAGGFFELLKALDNRRGGFNWPEICAAYNDCSELGAQAMWMSLAGYYRNKLLKCDQKSSPSMMSYYAEALDLFAHSFPQSNKPENALVSNLFRIMKIRLEMSSAR